jgi:hypothetical protein
LQPVNTGNYNLKAYFLDKPLVFIYQIAVRLKQLRSEGPAVLFHTPIRTKVTLPAYWLTAFTLLFVSLGLIYSAFHHHHDFSAHPDCPICTLAGQAPVITTPAEGPSPERTSQSLFQEAFNQPPDPLFSTSTAPRAPPA